MPLMDENLLQKLAADIVTRFQREKTALTDGVVDAAQGNDLNPEQIRRLVETTNNMAFTRRFEGAPDRVSASEFEPADANAALQRLINDAHDVMDAMAPIGGTAGGDSLAHDLAAPLPITHAGAPEPLPPPPAPEANEPKISSSVVVMRLRKTAEELRDRVQQARYEFTDLFQKLATAFTRAGGPRLEEFEADALYKWGAAAVPHLTLLRAALKRPAAEYDADVSIKVARVIDSRTPLMRDFGCLLIASDAVKQAMLAETKIKDYLIAAEKGLR
jgi:hypothetical protein